MAGVAGASSEMISKLRREERKVFASEPGQSRVDSISWIIKKWSEIDVSEIQTYLRNVEGKMLNKNSFYKPFEIGPEFNDVELNLIKDIVQNAWKQFDKDEADRFDRNYKTFMKEREQHKKEPEESKKQTQPQKK